MRECYFHSQPYQNGRRDGDHHSSSQRPGGDRPALQFSTLGLSKRCQKYDDRHGALNVPVFFRRKTLRTDGKTGKQLPFYIIDLKFHVVLENGI